MPRPLVRREEESGERLILPQAARYVLVDMPTATAPLPCRPGIRGLGGPGTAYSVRQRPREPSAARGRVAGHGIKGRGRDRAAGQGVVLSAELARAWPRPHARPDGHRRARCLRPVVARPATALTWPRRWREPGHDLVHPATAEEVNGGPS